ncbi:MAG: hypothetical protein EZS28_030729, partial [Streblomastix strix]
HALFTHLRDGAVLNMTPSQPLMDDRDANGSDTNVFASDREITVTDADAGPALRTSPKQEIQFFIMRFMELLIERNAFAKDFWANPIAQAQIRDYKTRILHAPEVTRHAEVPPHQVLNNAANSRVDGYIQNMQFQILMLYKLTILSIQHVLEGNTKESLIDLVGMCAALLRFAERSTYIRIQMKEGTDIRTRKSGLSQSASRPIFRNNDGTRATNSTAGDVQTNLDRIKILFRTTDTKTIDTTTISGVWYVHSNTTILRFSVARQPSISEGLPQFMLSSPTFGVQQTQQSNLLTPPAPSSAGHPTFQSCFQSQNLEQSNQQYSQQPTIRPPTLMQQQQIKAREHVYINGRLLDSPGTALTRRIAQDLQPLWNKENSLRTDQSLFTPVDPPELTINITQQQFNAYREFWAHRSYALRYIGLRSNGEHHRGFGEGFLNVSVFIQRHARHEYLTISEWKSFWRELDTDLYLDTVRMELDEDDNHHHHHDHDHDHDRNHRHDRERNDRNDQLDLGRGRKRRRIISSEGSGNGQNNDDWAEDLHLEVQRQQLRQFRIRRNTREQVLPPVQTVSGAPVYMPGLRAVHEEAFRVANHISPNLDEESSVSWTSAESINQERDTPIANFRTAQQLLLAQDNQEQLNQQDSNCYYSFREPVSDSEAW